MHDWRRAHRPRPQVLGLPDGADFDAVNRVYRKLMYDAKRANDKDRMEAIEAAHSVLMTRFMMQRIQSGANRSVAQADTAPLLPWRPRLLLWAYRWMALSLAVGSLPVLWALASPHSGPQPIQLTFFAYLILNGMKLWQWSPPPQNK